MPTGDPEAHRTEEATAASERAAWPVLGGRMAAAAPGLVANRPSRLPVEAASAAVSGVSAFRTTSLLAAVAVDSPPEVPTASVLALGSVSRAGVFATATQKCPRFQEDLVVEVVVQIRHWERVPVAVVRAARSG